MSRSYSFSQFQIISWMILLGSLLLPCNLFSQNKPDIWSFDSQVLDYQFNRADREIDPGRWMEEARYGIKVAQSLWEEYAMGMFDDSSQRQQASVEFNQWSETELENHFTQWLFKRFFGAETGFLSSALSKETENANKSLIYHLSAEGRIQYDAAANDPLIIRPGEEGHEWQKDLTEWQIKTEKSLDNVIQLFESHIIGSYPELLAFLEKDKRDEFGARLGNLGIKASLSFQNELKSIISREERYFTARRLGDNYSLRKKSENESAELTVIRLIEEANQSVSDRLLALQKKIETAEAGAEDLVLEGSEWLFQYRTQFERGLDAWARAEEQFFIRRMQWEQDSISNYFAGEEAWNRAFDQFETARQNWELEAKRLFDSGEALFKNASETLEKSIVEARAEFERDALLRSSMGADKAKAWADIYFNSGYMVAQAKENIAFWQEKYDTEKDSNNSLKIMEEINNWTGLYDFYYDKAIEAREILINEFSMVMGTGTLAEILKEGVSREDFFLDEYQIELIRAKAAASYWEKRTEIAEAVVQYAEDFTSGRLTEAEGIKAWELAKSEYNSALSRYEESMMWLKDSGEEIITARENMEEAANKLKESELKLDSLNKVYSDYMAVFIAGKKEYFIRKIDEKQNELDAIYKVLDDFNKDSLWYTYLTSVCQLELMNYHDFRMEILKEIEHGGQIYSISLTELEEEIKNFQEPNYSSKPVISKIVNEWQIKLNEAATEELRDIIN
ncbi:hypothetical protein [Leadbettera azotonutricia]|uniref:Uncharacterized protein n=1 Tax=Leadbettera azotonutricia (strain ATCC BAA-888 / DSM 13862 / ZAS-9) TaxID=545695 RepID=F5Y6N6_LEAAZ|nr:hypothetical protein [Leadbettera azotonutricia]AEF82164.1 hypothetical protein TREAZ_1234 [Leadbettera azotonutricia ZAS-9]